MRPFLLWLFALVANTASAATPYEMRNVVLLQPEFVLQERISAKALAPYIAALNTAAQAVLAPQRDAPAGGYLVVAVRPGMQSAAWLDFRPALPAAVGRQLIERLRAVPAPSVREGLVVFAIAVSLGGGTLPPGDLPHPDEWTKAQAQAGQPLEVSDLVSRVWPR